VSVAGVDDVNHVNSRAAVPTTSTSITMPFRKNLGFNEEASDGTGDAARHRGSSIASASISSG
jgi:hypothetical protein